MAIEQALPGDFAHPLDPLSAAEIRLAAETARTHTAANVAPGGVPAQKLLFNSISLREPNKHAVLLWSGLFTVKELRAAGAEVVQLVRAAEIHAICPVTRQSFELIVELPPNLGDLPESSARVVSYSILDVDLQPSLQPEELLWAEAVCQSDPKVKEACDAVGLDQKLLMIDGWCIGHDERFPGRRLQQCFAFYRLLPEDNLYAHPCDFVPIMDSHTGEILTIDYPPSNAIVGQPTPASSAASYTAAASRERFPPPMTPHNYLPEQIAKDEPDFKLRDTLKPLHVIQPAGVSYTLEGRTLKWQNWSVHVGFNYREGLVLSNITYDDGSNGVRPLFYRLSIAEMVVPYAKTIFPHHRKHAFDTGEYGIGALANSLALGCDCLGSITYLDGDFVTRAGGVETIKSAICIHEEDAGILHKHTDFRDMRAHVARNRKLVISSICTVANYEYGFYFNFALDGTIELEVKATGIVNSYSLREDEAKDPDHEVEVAPRIAAQHHQHLFSYRIDPMIDGLANRVVQVDTVPDDAEVGSETNFYGNGFKTVKEVFSTSKASITDYNAAKSRAWVIENPHRKHYATGGNTGYKIVSKDMPPMLAKPGSLMCVTQYHHDELFPSDIHINQQPGAKNFGIAKWIERDECVEDRDIVCWPCFGVTHISRPEDWPIMPVEILRVHLKPSAFFNRNPGLDVPSTADIQSRHATEAVVSRNGRDGSEAQVNGHTNSTPCCNGH